MQSERDKFPSSSASPKAKNSSAHLPFPFASVLSPRESNCAKCSQLEHCILKERRATRRRHFRCHWTSLPSFLPLALKFHTTMHCTPSKGQDKHQHESEIATRRGHTKQPNTHTHTQKGQLHQPNVTHCLSIPSKRCLSPMHSPR